jgi:hypothetical protein
MCRSAWPPHTPASNNRTPGTVCGAVLEKSPTSVVISTPTGVHHRFALDSLQSLEFYRGRTRSAGAKTGALWGVGIVGALIGAAVGGDEWNAVRLNAAIEHQGSGESYASRSTWNSSANRRTNIGVRIPVSF